MNFSDQLKQAVADQKVADCEKWKDAPLPASIVERVNAAGSTATPSPDQLALLDWFNRDIARVTKRQAYCG